jgi:hypothetical protein
MGGTAGTGKFPRAMEMARQKKKSMFLLRVLIAA